VHQVGDQPRLYYDARSINHQDRQGTYNIILRRVRVTIVAVEK